MELEVETALEVGNTTMISPSHGSAASAAATTTGGLIGNGLQHESLRLSEIESAHLCPSARVKMEELFKQWLNVDGTKDMIHAIVDDIRSGKDMDAIVAQYANPSSASGLQPQHGSSNHSTANVDLHSPSRSPKRPPNYHHFGGTSATSTGVHHSPNSTNSRKKHLVVSLFGDELHEAEKREQADVAMKEDEAATAAAPAVSTAADADQVMEEDNNNSSSNSAADEQTALKQLRKQIPKLYTPGEGRRGRLRGLSTDSMARKSVRD